MLTKWALYYLIEHALLSKSLVDLVYFRAFDFIVMKIRFHLINVFILCLK